MELAVVTLIQTGRYTDGKTIRITSLILIDRHVGEDRDFDRIDANAANIGFAASIDTGVSVGGQAVQAKVQCEQFTFYNQLAGGTGWCNRNSKLSLAGVWGEIGVAIWLLPFNEMVAGWVDPFYDAGLGLAYFNNGYSWFNQ